MESDNTWRNIHFSKFCLSQSQDSRREREFCPLNLEVRDENEIFLSISQGSRRDRDIFFQVSCFEMGLRDEISLILMRIFEIEKSCHALRAAPWTPPTIVNLDCWGFFIGWLLEDFRMRWSLSLFLTLVVFRLLISPQCLTRNRLVRKCSQQINCLNVKQAFRSSKDI